MSPGLTEIDVVGCRVQKAVAVAPVAAGAVNVSGLIFVLEYGLGRGPGRRRGRRRRRRRFRSGGATAVGTGVQVQRGRGQRGVGQPERVARPLHLGQLLAQRLVLVQVHVQLRRVIVVRDGRRGAVGQRQQRVVGTGQVVSVPASSTLAGAGAVRPPSGR